MAKTGLRLFSVIAPARRPRQPPCQRDCGTSTPSPPQLFRQRKYRSAACSMHFIEDPFVIATGRYGLLLFEQTTLRRMTLRSSMKPVMGSTIRVSSMNSFIM